MHVTMRWSAVSPIECLEITHEKDFILLAYFWSLLHHIEKKNSEQLTFNNFCITQWQQNIKQLHITQTN